jgi:tetratricopeptide (TPR) repeat protein
VLAVSRRAAQEAQRAFGHGKVRAAAVAADLPKHLPPAPAAPRPVAQLRLDWRLRQAQQLNRTGTDARRAGRAGEAVAAHRRAVEIYREAGDGRREALSLSALALAEAQLDPEAAVASFEAALEILRRLGDERTEGQVLANLGVVHHRLGRDDAAYRCWADALPRLDPASPEHARLAERLQLAS